MSSTIRVSTKTVKKESKSSNYTLKNYGYVADGKGVPPEYLVRIVSYRNKAVVVGVLQEDISMRVESRWDYILPSSILDPANRAVQLVSGGRWSVITKATSRRLWQGSSPLQLSLNLKFEAVNNPYEEVVQPCKFLQAMALPSNVKISERAGTIIGAKLKSMGGNFLSPPGPTPFTTKGLLTKDNTRSISDIVKGLESGDLIKVDLGRFLSFWNVIVKEVSPVFSTKFSRSGDPISASVNIIFESYEMMTTESLDRSYDKTSFSPKVDINNIKGKVIKSRINQ